MVDSNFMVEAIAEAKKSLEFHDVPIGCVIVKDGVIIGRGHNQVERLKSPTAHAEIIAINEAVANNDYKFLLDSTIYTTLEPCSMCSGAIILSRIKRIVIGAMDTKGGCCGSLYSLPKDQRFNHRCEITQGILAEECTTLLKDFFRKLRKKEILNT